MWNVGLNGAPRLPAANVARPLLLGGIVPRGSSRGFTLVEMMVVVTIISILATLAVVGFRKITQSSHVSEATNMVQNIRVAQEGYHSETQQYANISGGIPSGSGASMAGLYPATPKYGILTAWGAACTVCNSNIDWSVLPLHVDGPVLFGYATIANSNGGACAPSVTVNGVSGFALAPTGTCPSTDWYEIGAEADLDGIASGYTDVFGVSWSNQIVVSNEGQ
jgi:type IV pilus assembly protein PilA